MSKAKHRRPSLESVRLANWQIVVLALWSLGGATARQHTEDVAVKSWQLAPQRFSWEKYPEHPNLDTARVALSDAKKEKYGSFVRGDQLNGWLLTPAGVSWARRVGDSTQAISGSLGVSALRQEVNGALMALESTRVFQSWQAGNTDFELYELADAIQLPADAPRSVIRARVEELSNGATISGKPGLEEFLTWLEQRIG